MIFNRGKIFGSDILYARDSYQKNVLGHNLAESIELIDRNMKSELLDGGRLSFILTIAIVLALLKMTYTLYGIGMVVEAAVLIGVIWFVGLFFLKSLIYKKRAAFFHMAWLTSAAVDGVKILAIRQMITDEEMTHDELKEEFDELVSEVNVQLVETVQKMNEKLDGVED